MLSELVEQLCITFGIEPKIEVTCGNLTCDVEPPKMKYECPECLDFILSKRKIYPYLSYKYNIEHLIMDIISDIDDYYIVIHKLSNGYNVSLFLDYEDGSEYSQDGDTLQEALISVLIEMGPGLVSKEQILKLFEN